jgi:hypothetical protein
MDVFEMEMRKMVLEDDLKQAEHKKETIDKREKKEEKMKGDDFRKRMFVKHQIQGAKTQIEVLKEIEGFSLK